MKRHGDLFGKIVSFGNILLAWRKGRLGKSRRRYTVSFGFDQERRILRLQESLKDGTYRPGAYKTFQISEPKERTISAAPFTDRVVHHCVCNIVSPLFEKTFIHQTFANLKGRGTHRAVLLYMRYARRYPFVLKCDIRKYFPSIDHEILKEIVARKIKCRRTLELINLIIDGSNPQESMTEYFTGDGLFTPFERRRGLPIGNLTSQFLANVYLSGLDHFVKEKLGCGAYIRYVDDFVLFGGDKKTLNCWKADIVRYLEGLRLKMHEGKSRIYRTADGVSFLGYKVLPDGVLLKSGGKMRIRKKLRRYTVLMDRGLFPKEWLRKSLAAWKGHLRFARTLRFRRALTEEFRLRERVNHIEEQGMKAEQTVVLRGGSWNNDNNNLRCANRNNNTPGNRNNNIGFRVANTRRKESCRSRTTGDTAESRPESRARPESARIS